MSQWRITWGEKSWTRADLTVAHVAAIMEINGVDDWAFCNPVNGPMKLLGMLAVLIGREIDVKPDVMLGELSKIPAEQLLATLTILDDPVPDADAEPAALATARPRPAPTKRTNARRK